MIPARRAMGIGTIGFTATCLAASVGCANEQPPPGALPDHDPPRIESIEPAPDSVVVGFDGQVRVRFNEPVRVERGWLQQQIIVSPMEPYTAETGFSDFRLEPRDGWRDSVVYCMEIPSGIRDVLSNQTTEGTEFCFSTGAPLIDSRVTGTVFDAVTGAPASAASVLFLAPPDSTPYGALTDGQGRFLLRSLPTGEYTAFGFNDQNRNNRVDKTLEPYDSVTVSSFEGARPDLLFRLVEPDSTPPRLLRAETPDSFTVRVEFDDALLNPQPGLPTITIADSATGTPVAVFGVELGEPLDVVFANDPVAGDSAAAADTVAAPPPPPATPGPAADSTPTLTGELPVRVVTVRVFPAISPGTYRIDAEGFVNLRQLTGGGDTTFVAEFPLPDSTAVADSAAAADSAGVATDTAGVVIDTAGVAPDTTGAAAGDTLRSILRGRAPR